MGLSWLDIGAMSGALALLAAVPSVSVAAVVARAASAGFAHGALAALGIVAGDILFILAAIFGLVLLTEALGDVFAWVRLLGGAYLLWLGVTLLRSRTVPRPQPISWRMMPRTASAPWRAKPAASTSRTSSAAISGAVARRPM